MFSVEFVDIFFAAISYCCVSSVPIGPPSPACALRQHNCAKEALRPGASMPLGTKKE